MMRYAFRLTVLLWAVCLSLGCPSAEAQAKRILIVGDSWAASIATTQHDGPGFGSLDAVLKANGLGEGLTQGAVTAWGGRKASHWASKEYLAKVDAELAAHPGIDIIHLIIGGNDFLGLTKTDNIVKTYPDKVQRQEKLWKPICENIRTTVEHILKYADDHKRPMRILLSDYDYLGRDQAAPFGFFQNMTQREVNDMLVEFGDYRCNFIMSIPRCYYVSHWGVLQQAFEDASLPVPGGPPKYIPYAGGNPDKGMPSAGQVGDGIHPNDEGHRKMLQRCVDQFYKQWLATPKQ